MIVYVESNFVLELAFLQQEHPDCEVLLEFAQAETIQLVLPAFCVGEPYEAWLRKSTRRKDLHRRLHDEIQELSRSAPYRGPSAKLQELIGLLTESRDEEKARLNATLERVLNVVELIAITARIVGASTVLQQARQLPPQDSIVYASVLEHLVQAPKGDQKCFINKNSKDFVTPEILGDLNAYSCKLLTKFSDGLGYIRSQVGPDVS